MVGEAAAEDATSTVDMEEVVVVEIEATAVDAEIMAIVTEEAEGASEMGEAIEVKMSCFSVTVR